MQRVSKYLGWRSMAIVAVVALSVAAGSFMRTPDTSTATTATTYNAKAGETGPGAATFLSVFLPSSMVIAEGDSIRWSNSSNDPHTVTFLAGKPPTGIAADFEEPLGGRNPSFDGTNQIHSGFILPDPSTNYTVKFTKAGSFPFVCIIHPGMEGTVTVLSPGLFVPTQAQVDVDARKQQTDAEAAARRMLASAATAPIRSQAGNQVNWTIPASPYAKVPNGFVMQNLFTPARVSIGAGDSVTWVNDTPAAHIVTFNPAGDPTTPNNVKSVGPGVFATSGFLGTGAEFFNGGTSYTLSFPTPGTYTYICVLHIDQGMAGVVQVGAPGSGGPAAGGPPAGGPPPISPPSTGDAGLLSGASAAWPLALAVALAGIVTLGVMRARTS